jgi:hypothetical protein
MNRIFLCFVAVFMFATFSSQAQLLERLAREAARQTQRSAEERARKEVQKEVDKQVNKAIDEVLEGDSTAVEKEKTATPRSDSERASALMSAMGISTEVIDFEENYVFTSEIVTLSESTDADGNIAPSVETIMAVNEKNEDVMIVVKGEGQQAVTIIDNSNACMLLLTHENGKKSGIATKINIDNSDSIAENVTVPLDAFTYGMDDEQDECKPVKTGKSKTISGFKCQEYRCETETEIEILWTTKDVDFKENMKDVSWIGNFSTNAFEGMIIRAENHSKQDKSSTIMTVTGVDWNKNNNFSTKEYEISSFSFDAGQ